MADCPPMNGYCRDQIPRLENYAKGFLSIRSVKLFADGALGSWGAAMIDDYSDKPGHRGTMLLEYERLESLVKQVLPPLTISLLGLLKHTPSLGLTSSGTTQGSKSTSMR